MTDLRVGLTGGIGAGKSTVARTLASLGAAVVDADVVAREVVEPGEPALAALVEAFGEDILTGDRLDRAALARLAFADQESTARLGTIVHPAVAARTAQLMAAAADSAILVHDVPLLVENGMEANYHLVILVDVPAELRLERLVRERGMEEGDARARISRQASDEQRRAACDVVIDNSGAVEETAAAVRQLVDRRLRPFAENIRLDRPAVDPGRAALDARARRRTGARLRRAVERAEEAGVEVREAPLTLRARDSAQAQRLEEVLRRAGFPRAGHGRFASADPALDADVVLSF